MGYHLVSIHLSLSNCLCSWCVTSRLSPLWGVPGDGTGNAALGVAGAARGSIASVCKGWLFRGLEHFLFSHIILIYIGNNHPNWLSYFSDGWPNHQPVDCLSVYLTMYLSIYPSIHLSIFPIQSSSAPIIPNHHLRLITIGKLNMWGYLVL